MSRRNEQSFDEPRYIRQGYVMGSVRRYKLASEGEIEPGTGGWQRELHFISDLAGGGEASITIRAKTKPKLDALLAKIRLVEQLEATALSKFREGDINRADFNREQAVRMRESLAKEGVTDLPEREWRWENNQLIFRGQQKMF